MARVKDISKGGSLFARIGFLYSKWKFGRVPQPLRIAALHSKILKGYSLMEMAQEKAKRVSGAIKILDQVRVATIIGCPFWIDIGSAVSRELGITEEKLQELTNYENSSLFSSEEKAVLKYGDAMTSNPAEIPDEIFKQIKIYFDDS